MTKKILALFLVCSLIAAFVPAFGLTAQADGVYDRIEFRFVKSFVANIEIEESFATVVKHYSNTGDEITETTDENGTPSPVAVTYESSNTNVATVSQTGIISAVGPGAANIIASATIGGVTKSAMIGIVVEPQYIYNYYKLANNGKKADGLTDITTVTSFAYTTKGDPLEIWPESSIETSPWHYVAHDATTFQYNNDTYPMTLAVTSGGRDASVGKWIRYKIKVDEDGIYRAANNFSYINTGPIVRIFLAPEDADDPEAPEYSIGCFDTYATGTTNNIEKILATLELPAGNYLLTYKIVGYNSAVTASFVAFRYSSFKLARSDAATRPYMNVDLSNGQTLGIGDSVTLDLNTEMSDGSAQDAYAADITAVSHDDSIATVSLSRSADRLDNAIQINGVTAGKTTIDVIVSVNGMVSTKSIPVVVEDESLTAPGIFRVEAVDSKGEAIADAEIGREGETPVFEQDADNSFSVGTEFSISAPEITGKDFLYWKDAKSGRIAATNKNMTFRLGSNTHLNAVYKDTEDGVLVQFIDRNNKVLQSAYINETNPSTVAPSPYSVGYDFINWKSGELTIQGGETVTSAKIGGTDTIFAAQYEKSEEQFNVTVTGSTNDGTGTCYYDDKIIVYAGAPGEGQKFAYWKRNDKPISYNPTYSFYVWDDTDVAAVFIHQDEELMPVPKTIMDVAKADDGLAIFASEYSVPTGYDLIENGILIANNPTDASESAFILDNLNVKKATSLSKKKEGQFTVRTDGAGTKYARAYLIYKDNSTNTYKIVYSQIVTA